MPSTDTALVSARPSISVNGASMPAMSSSVIDMAVHLPADGLAHAELTLNNWGPQADGTPGFAFNHLRLGDSLAILVGDVTCFSGDITALEERYGDGAPRLVLLAEDALHRLARQRGSRSWEALSLDDLLRQAAQGAGLQADVQVDGAARDWLQHNESPLAFLRRLLAPLAVPLRLQDGKLWARAEVPDAQPLALNAGGNASQLRLIADLAQQVHTAVAQGFDIAAGEPVAARANSLQPAPAGSTAAEALASVGWPGETLRPHPMPRDQAQATALAAGHLRQLAQRFMHGEIVCASATTLRGGREVTLTGVSPRLAGRWWVADCWHHFDAQRGLSTRLKVQRADWPRGSA